MIDSSVTVDAVVQAMLGVQHPFSEVVKGLREDG